MTDHKMLIDGELVDAQGGATFADINPATEGLVAEVPDATAADLDAATAAARRAFDAGEWSTNRGLRSTCLTQLQAAMESAAREELRADLVAEAGCPIALTYGPQLDGPLDHALRWPLEYLERFAWIRDEGDFEKAGGVHRHLVTKEPVGVVAAITPWNFPFEVELTKIAQALATGNTVVLKVAPDTPLHALRLARLVAEATDLPPGVLNIVTPSRHEIAEALIHDPRVDLVSFTGSTPVGQRILEAGAPTCKRSFLELGGKSAHIVLADADLPSVMATSAGVATHAGQGCAMLTRLLLPRDRYDEAVELAAPRFEQFPVGDPTDPVTMCGPVINERQRDRILGYMERAVDDGARVVAGGSDRPDGLEKGWFVRPTLLAAVDNEMEVARDEVFGPVLVAIPYDDVDDAVRIANDSPYGLAGAVSGSPALAQAVAHRIRAGTISVNGANPYAAHMPFGGYKASGAGRQNGPEGFEQYLETKSMAVPAAEADEGSLV